jgi:predicted  nucleic acid-binding Zn-ribbon protein
LHHSFSILRVVKISIFFTIAKTLRCRKRLGGLEHTLGELQRELQEAQEALARQADDHQAELSAAAEGAAAVLRDAQEQLDTAREELAAKGEGQLEQLQVRGWAGGV